MDKRVFIENFKSDTSKTSVMDIVYGELVEYCRENNISEDMISTSELEEIAEDIIENGDF